MELRDRGQARQADRGVRRLTASDCAQLIHTGNDETCLIGKYHQLRPVCGIFDWKISDSGMPGTSADAEGNTSGMISSPGTMLSSPSGTATLPSHER
jgi:hypothetical protein